MEKLNAENMGILCIIFSNFFWELLKIKSFKNNSDMILKPSFFYWPVFQFPHANFETWGLGWRNKGLLKLSNLNWKFLNYFNKYILVQMGYRCKSSCLFGQIILCVCWITSLFLAKSKSFSSCGSSKFYLKHLVLCLIVINI